MTKIKGIIHVPANTFQTSTEGYQVGFLTCQSSMLKNRVE